MQNQKGRTVTLYIQTILPLRENIISTMYSYFLCGTALLVQAFWDLHLLIIINLMVTVGTYILEGRNIHSHTHICPRGKPHMNTRTFKNVLKIKSEKSPERVPEDTIA